MKKSILLAACLLISGYLFSQDYVPQFDSATLMDKPLVNLNKEGFLGGVNMIANTRFASNNNFVDGKFTNSAFQANELRMELVGKVTDKISFRFRDRYMSVSTDAYTTDALRHSVDLLYADYVVSPKFTFTLGKMLSEWGSYEIDINPVTMYAYNDMIQYGDFFLTGAKASFKATKEHSFSLQVINSQTRSFDMLYGNTPGVEASKAPLGATANWRGKFADGLFSTMWSYSYYNLAKDKYWQLIALGNQLKTSDLTLQYDFKYSNQDIDNLGIVSNLTGHMPSNRALDVRYMEHWVRAEYFFGPRWSTTIMGMVNTNYWKGNPDTSAERVDKIRDLWTFSAAIEYHLIRPFNVKVFAAYVGRYSTYTSYARNQFGAANGNTGQILVGIVSPLLLF